MEIVNFFSKIDFLKIAWVWLEPEVNLDGGGKIEEKISVENCCEIEKISFLTNYGVAGFESGEFVGENERNKFADINGGSPTSIEKSPVSIVTPT